MRAFTMTDTNTSSRRRNHYQNARVARAIETRIRRAVKTGKPWYRPLLDISSAFVQRGIDSFEKENYDEAADAFLCSFMIQGILFGDRHPSTALLAYHLSLILDLAGDHDTARQVRADALQAFRGDSPSPIRQHPPETTCRI